MENDRGNNPEQIQKILLDTINYAHIEIVATFLVVIFLFFGHNSKPHHAFWTKIGGNLPLSLRELSIPIRDLFESNKR